MSGSHKAYQKPAKMSLAKSVNAGGSCYQWIRKEKGKTVSVAMSAEQYEAMAAAIANWKRAKLILRRMEQISRRIIFTTLPDTRRSKPLTDEVLGLS